MKIIVCNDTRTHPESEGFPWSELQSFNGKLNGLMGREKFRNYDSSYPDPLIKFRYVETSGKAPAGLVRLQDEYVRLKEQVGREREQMNVDARLCSELRSRNHEVKLFDSQRLNVLTKLWIHEKDANKAGADLTDIVSEFGCDGMVYDLDYFGHPNHGRQMLKMMVNSRVFHSRPKVVVYSKFLHDPGSTPDELVAEFPTVEIICVDRLGGGGISALMRHFVE